jgi:hypothetical protein
MSFDVYNPDTFFFRSISIDDFKPDVIKYINSFNSRSTGGPTVFKSSSISNYDSGTPNFYYEYTKLNNIDEFISESIKTYTINIDILNDIVSNCNGNVVGGTDGKFRFDGSSSYYDDIKDVKNDIDDYLKYGSEQRIESFIPFKIKEIVKYKKMSDTFIYSRLYPQLVTVHCPINDKVGQEGEIIGTTGYNDINTVYDFVLAKSRIQFIDSGNNIVKIKHIDNEESLIDKIKVGDKVDVVDGYGKKILEKVNVISVTNDFIILSSNVGIKYGSLLLNSDKCDSGYQHYS